MRSSPKLTELIIEVALLAQTREIILRSVLETLIFHAANHLTRGKIILAREGSLTHVGAVATKGPLPNHAPQHLLLLLLVGVIHLRCRGTHGLLQVGTHIILNASAEPRRIHGLGRAISSGHSRIKRRLGQIGPSINIADAHLLLLIDWSNKRVGIIAIRLKWRSRHCLRLGVDRIIPRQNLWRNLNGLCCLTGLAAHLNAPSYCGQSSHCRGRRPRQDRRNVFHKV